MVTGAFIAIALVLAMLALGATLQPVWRGKPLVGGAMIAALLLATGLMYVQVGTPAALDPAQRESPATLGDAITRMEAELERDPQQVEGWRLLARAYAAESRNDDARNALARAVKSAPDNPDVLAEAAEARARAAEGRRFDDAAVAMLRHALEVEPRHQRARWFLGIAQRQSGQDEQAVETWSPLLDMVDARTAASLREQINLARADAGMDASPAVAATPTPGTAADTDAGIVVSVSLDPALAMQLPDGASLFVIARQPDGPPMPVAVEKLRITGFPVKVTLDDGDSPMPTAALSQLDRVEITARISASGDARAQPGDFEANPVLVETGRDASAALLIDRVVE